jgi:hypothetical protein
LSYVAEVAEAVRHAIPDDLLPDEDVDELIRMYAVLALAKGEELTAEDVHDAWAVWMSTIDPSHPGLRPFSELDEDTQRQDEPFVEAIRAVARRLGRAARGVA